MQASDDVPGLLHVSVVQTFLSLQSALLVHAGHPWVLHACVVAPTQSAPPHAGAGLVQVCDCVPPPQETEHAVQGDQAPFVGEQPVDHAARAVFNMLRYQEPEPLSVIPGITVPASIAGELDWSWKLLLAASTNPGFAVVRLFLRSVPPMLLSERLFVCAAEHTALYAVAAHAAPPKRTVSSAVQRIQPTLSDKSIGGTDLKNNLTTATWICRCGE